MLHRVNKPLRQKVKDAISNGVPTEYFDDYLKAVIENVKRTEDKYHGYILLLLFSIVIFELVTRASVTEVSLGPIKVNDLSLLHKYIPVVIAYLYYAVVALGTMRTYLGRVYAEVTEVVHKPIYDNDLDFFIVPASPLMLTEIVGNYFSGRLSTLVSRGSDLTFYGLWIAPFIFEVYAYYRCFTVFSPNSIHVWVSLIFSIIFLLQGLLVILHEKSL